VKNTLKITATITDKNGLQSIQNLYFPTDWDVYQRWAFIRLKETVELCDVRIYESDMHSMETGMSNADLYEAYNALYSREDIEAQDFNDASGDR
jgi:hypothetical protein